MLPNTLTVSAELRAVGGLVASSIKALLGLNLQRLMARDGLSKSELAEKLGEDQSKVSRWIAGKTLPRAEQIDHICATFGLKHSELLSEEGLSPSNYSREIAENLEDVLKKFAKPLGLRIIKDDSK